MGTVATIAADGHIATARANIASLGTSGGAAHRGSGVGDGAKMALRNRQVQHELGAGAGAPVALAGVAEAGAEAGRAG